MSDLETEDDGEWGPTDLRHLSEELLVGQLLGVRRSHVCLDWRSKSALFEFDNVQQGNRALTADAHEVLAFADLLQKRLVSLAQRDSLLVDDLL